MKHIDVPFEHMDGTFEHTRAGDIEVCLGCGKPTADRDCGCPAGTGWRRENDRVKSGRELLTQ